MPKHSNLAFLAVLLLVSPGLAQDDVVTPTDAPESFVSATPTFAFYSDLATNLNDALITAGRARSSGEAEILRSGAEKPCFAELPVAERAAWDAAVDYYAEVISPAHWGDDQQMLIRSELAGLRGEGGPKEGEDRRFLELAEHLRASAAPAYTTCRWPAQDAQNRRWIEDAVALLALHEDNLVTLLEQLYQRSWDGLPIRFDVVETPTNSIISSPEGGHILISSSNDGNQGAAALEMVFHEASHLLTATFRDDPLPAALEDAADRLDVSLPGDLWHVVLFYMTGETVRRVLVDAGEPDYTPYVYANGLFERGAGGRWRMYEEPIETAWPSYLDGEQTLSQAAADLVRVLGEQGESRP